MARNLEYTKNSFDVASDNGMVSRVSRKSLSEASNWSDRRFNQRNNRADENHGLAPHVTREFNSTLAQ